MLFLFVLSAGDANAQSAAGRKSRYKGQYWGGQKKFGVERKKFQHIKKRKKRQSIKHKDNVKRKTNQRTVKNRRKRTKKMRSRSHRKKYSIKGKNKSLYSSYMKKQSKSRKGSYPKSKLSLGNKWVGIVGAGVVVTPQSSETNISGQPTDVFSEYNIGPSFTLGAFYNVNNSLALGSKIRLFPLSKDFFKVNTLSVSADFIYKPFGRSRSPIKPYVTAGLTLSLTNISQEGFEDVNVVGIDFDTTDHKVEDPHVLVESIEIVESEVRTPILPLLGYRVGAGFDYKVNSQISVYLQVDYDNSFAKNNSTLLNYFNYNQSNFNFVNFTAGIKIGLSKSNSLY